MDISMIIRKAHHRGKIFSRRSIDENVDSASPLEKLTASNPQPMHSLEAASGDFTMALYDGA